MKKAPYLLFIFIACLPSIAVHALSDSTKKIMNTLRTPEAPVIDGKLNEPVWASAEKATDFIQSKPNPGWEASQRTVVRVLFDNNALYIGAKLYDASADSIFAALTLRDDQGNADWFYVYLDPYQDGINGVALGVTAAGVQQDVKYSVLGADRNWDAVWRSAVEITEAGWTVEMKIPYSAIRFANAKEQTWGINFSRLVRRIRQESWWNPYNPESAGILTQTGLLMGIENIQPPLRLSLTPYLSFYLQNYQNKEFNLDETGTSIHGGLDLKYGINDAFTLDMTLIPDFGQVQADNEILNLTPYEVKYTEKRQFFTEGTELFSKVGLFYSRRIGSIPFYYFNIKDYMKADETLVTHPAENQLLNAVKISGRTSGNLGIGVFNAVENETMAIVENQQGIQREVRTNPLTNYNVIVLDQGLKNNSYASLINTNVYRAGKAYEANVTGSEIALKNKSNSYQILASGAVSQKYFDGFQDTEIGYRYYSGLSKISGNLKFTLYHSTESDLYDPNDLGYIQNNNIRITGLDWSYELFEPFGTFNSARWNGNIFYGKLFEPAVFTGVSANAEMFMMTNDYFAFGLTNTFQPFGWKDYFEPRVSGRFYAVPQNNNFGVWASTDYRQKMAIDVSMNQQSFADDQYGYTFRVAPRLQPTNSLFFVYQFERSQFVNDKGFATFSAEGLPIFGQRDVKTVINSLEGHYIFNNKMGITYEIRHYWSSAKYKSFFDLSSEGILTPIPYTGLDTDGNPRHNVNFNALNSNIAFSWRFAPGSEISIVWQYAIIEEGTLVIPRYIENVGHVAGSPFSNSISVKIFFYLDYLMARKWRILK